MSRLSMFLVALLSLAAREAKADAVPPPPKDCPPGTHGVTDHAGPGCVKDDCPQGSYGAMCVGGPCCVASQCGGDAGRSCSSSARCEEVRACTRPRSTVGWAATRIPVKEELALCDASGGCPEGGKCETLRVCVTTSAKTPSKAKGFFGCGVPSPGEAPGAAAALALVAAAAVARRRRR